MNILILALYFAFLLAVGVVFGRMVKTSEDYFKAGAQATWWLVGSSMFMAGISAYTFVGNAAGIYQAGWSPLAIYAANVCSFIIGALGVAALYRQMRVVTVAEVLHVRFGKATEQIVAVFVVLNSLIWSGVVLYGLSIFSHMLFPDTSPVLLIVVVGAIVLLYCTFGGNWAIMANDFVQGLILVSMTVTLTLLCLDNAGGVSGFIEAISNSSEISRDFSLFTPVNEAEGETFWTAKYGISWAIAVFVTQLLVQTGLFLGVRYFSAKDGVTARKSALLAMVLMGIGCLVFFIPPMYARLFLGAEVLAMAPDPIKAPEYAYAVASQQLLPNGLFSIMIVAMFAAAISSMDTGLNRNAALIVRDILPGIYKLFGKERIPAHKEVFAGRIATLVCGLLIILLGIAYATNKNMGLFDMMLNIISIFLVPQMVPLILFLVIRKTAQWAALSSIFCGFLPTLLNLFFDFGWSYQVQTFYILGGTLLGYLVAVPFYKHSSQAYRDRIEAFYRQMHRPIEFETEIGAGNDAAQMILIGKFGTALGALLTLLLLVPNEPKDRMYVAGVVGFILIVSLTLMFLGKKKRRSTLSATPEKETHDA